MLQRILLKLSGEALSGKERKGFDEERVQYLVEEVLKIHKMGICIGLVVGAGNIFRGKESQKMAIIHADQIGMLGTMINAIYLKQALEKQGLAASVFSRGIDIPSVRPFQYDSVRSSLDAGEIVLFGGGTSNPLFTTDTAAALRAVEMGAQRLIKATKVDGIYSDDPRTNPHATRFSQVTFQEALEKRLGVMDAEAFSICHRFSLPIQVIDFFRPDELQKAVLGEPVGTLVE
ncbi:MAG TPA: UMP kinase [Thermotogota bacterium]|nr:UMP kinase [Thermotogota bacterium]HRW92669.1 UMP kinase [Thermotogota bacterium]